MIYGANAYATTTYGGSLADKKPGGIVITKAIGYAVLTNQGIALGLQYGVSLSTTLDKNIQYVVRSETELTKGLLYFVKSTPAPKELGITYVTVTSRSSNKDFSYKVKNEKATNKTASYTIHSKNQTTKVAEYKVLHQEKQEKDIIYNILSSISVSKTLGYEIAKLITTSSATAITTISATGNGEILDAGSSTTVRGFVFGSTSQPEPGDVPPDESDYTDFVQETPTGSSIFVQRGSVTQPAGTAITTITLATPVPVGKSWALLSLRASGSPTNTALATAILKTEVSGHYTQLEIRRATGGGGVVADYSWEVITGDDFTVQSGETNMVNNETEVDQAISSVNLSSSFLVVSIRTNNANALVGYVLGRYTSSTNIRFEHSSPAVNNQGVVHWYSVSWAGATVQSGLTDFPASTLAVNETITSVDRAKTFVQFSFITTAGQNSGRTATSAILTSNDNLRLARAVSVSAPYGKAAWFVVSHPNIKVQYGETTLEETDSDSITLGSPVTNLSATFVPTPLQGNASQNTNSNNTLNNGYNSRHLSNASTLVIERANSNNNLFPSWFVVEGLAGGFPAEPYSLALSTLAPATTYYYRAFVFRDGKYRYGNEVSFLTLSDPVSQYVLKSIDYFLKFEPTTTKGIVYAIKTDTEKTKDQKYAIRRDIDSSRTISYKVRTAREIEKSFKYLIVASQKLITTIGYATKNIKVSTKAIDYSIKSKSEATKVIGYKVLHQESQSKELSYLLGNTIFLEKDLLYKVKSVPGIDLGFRYIIASRTILDLGISYVVHIDPYCPRPTPYSPKDGIYSPKTSPYAGEGSPYEPKNSPYSPLPRKC